MTQSLLWDISDAPAVGELTVEKKGEILDGFKGGLLASSYEKEFIYKEGSLAGAKFEVYAAEDITQQIIRKMQTATALSITARETL